MRVPGGRAHVQAHLPGVDLREEVPAELREQQQRDSHEPTKNAVTVERACDSAQASGVAIRLAEALEAVLEAAMDRA